MSFDSKVIWSEGMFLNPQHFQQQERYFERYVNGKCEIVGAYNWGVSEFEIDQELLKLGKLSVIRAKGVFPDGTPFSIPDLNPPPPVIELAENLHDQVVRLAIPVKRPGAVDVTKDEQSQSHARFTATEYEVRDVTIDSGENLKIDVADLRFKVLLESDDLSGYNSIAVLKISETREDKNVVLDDQFVPTCVDINVSVKLSGFLTELVGLLKHRADAIAGRLADTRRGGTAEIADYMMLQFINRVEPFIYHLTSINGLHPVTMYAEMLQIVGEISTFVAKEKRPPSFTPYLHENLTETFKPVMGSLRQSLSMVYEQTAVSLPLVEKKYGIRVSEITDRSMLASGMYVISARADVAEDLLRTRLPAQIKIGPVERIRQLVNAAMPGIQLKPLPVAPRQIPYRAGYTYFELEKNNNFWKELQTSGGFALHIGGDFPGLELEFWAVRQ